MYCSTSIAQSPFSSIAKCTRQAVFTPRSTSMAMASSSGSAANTSGTTTATSWCIRRSHSRSDVCAMSLLVNRLTLSIWLVRGGGSCVGSRWPASRSRRPAADLVDRRVRQHRLRGVGPVLGSRARGVFGRQPVHSGRLRRRAWGVLERARARWVRLWEQGPMPVKDLPAAALKSPWDLRSEKV